MVNTAAVSPDLAHRWEGSPSFSQAVRMAAAMIDPAAPEQSNEERLVGSVLAGVISQARPLVCPAEQLVAIPDDVFSDLGAAFEYAARVRLPFPATYFDFTAGGGRGVPLGLHFVEGGGHDLGLELRSVVAAESPAEQETLYAPIVGARGHPPEELGLAIVSWSPEVPGSAKPLRWTESLPLSGREVDVNLMSVSAAMEALDETPRAVAGALLGCVRTAQMGPSVEQLRAQLATASAVAVTAALKVLYLLDSVNVDVNEITTSRQVRRQAARSGAEIAWTIAVRKPQSRAGETSGEGGREFSHRFEVRGHFAHHPAGSWLYERSDPEAITACPRCGACRRVWRPPHVKGPTDRPLAVKIRRVEFDDEGA